MSTNFPKKPISKSKKTLQKINNIMMIFLPGENLKKITLSIGHDLKIILYLNLSINYNNSMHLYQPRKKLCLDDITYFSNKTSSPFSYASNKVTKKSITPTNRKTNLSPCLTPKGMMKERISKKIEQYKALDKREINNSIENLRGEEKKLRKSPLINKNSKVLYQKVSKQRNLSPNVLERFAQYEKDKSIKKIKMKIVSYHEETQRLPRPQQISETKCEQELVKIQNFLSLLQKSQKTFLR